MKFLATPLSLTTVTYMARLTWTGERDTLTPVERVADSSVDRRPDHHHAGSVVQQRQPRRRRTHCNQHVTDCTTGTRSGAEVLNTGPIYCI